MLATGSSAFVPPIPGRDAAGCFVYRTIEDLEAIRDWSTARPGGVGAVIGGGLLGLEAAYALSQAGDEGPRDRVRAAADGAAARRDRRRGAAPPDRGPGRRGPHRRRRPRRSSPARTAACGRCGSPTATSWTSICWSSRPASARATSWRAPRGCRSASAAASSSTRAAAPRTPRSTPSASAPRYEGRCYGLVAPGYQMARAAVSAICDADRARRDASADAADAVFTGFDMSTKLKLMGVDVASFGDAFGWHAGAHVVSLLDTSAALYKKLVLSPDRKHLLGGMLVGDASAYGELLQLAQNRIVLPPEPESLILPAGEGERPAGLGVTALPDAAQICSCNNVSKGEHLQRHPRPEADRGRRGEELHQGRHDLRLLRPAGHRPAQDGAEEGRRRRQRSPLRALPAQPAAALSPGPLPPAQDVRRAPRPARPRPRLRDLQARRGVDPGLGLERARAQAEAPPAAGHQRSLHGQHPARRDLLGHPARGGRRDHAGGADRHRADRRQVRPLHQDHRRAADRHAGRAARAAARTSGASWSTPGSSRGTPTARRCAR